MRGPTRFMKVLTLLFISIFVPPAYAASGQIKFRENVYLNNEPSPVPQSDTEGVLQFEDRKPLSNSWLVQVQPSARLYDAPRAGAFVVDFDGRNSYLETRANNFYLELGSFIKEWSGTDGINPMDIATIKSYRDPINSQSLGSWGIAAKSRGLTSWSWQMFYVPWQTSTKLPLAYTGWWPRTTTLPLNLNGVQALLPGDFTYDIDSPEILNQADENNFGARLQFHGNSWDAALAAFQGQSQVPLFRTTVQGNVVEASPIEVVQMTNPVHIQPVEYLRRTVSALFVYNQNPWIYRIAGRYDLPVGSDSILPGWSEQFVGGLERTLVLANQTVILSLQYARAVMPSPPQSILNLSDPFQSALLWGARWPLNENLLLAYSGLNDFKFHSYYDNLTLQDSIGEHWSFSLAAEVIGGPTNSLFGTWKDQSRGYLTATYGF